MARVELDEIDSKILREYFREARLSYREVARRVRIAVGTVMARTKRLEAEGVIKSYTAVLDHEKLGYGLTAVTEITVSKGKLVEMEKEIAKMPVACAVYDVTGLTDALIIAKFRSREELSDF